MRTLYYTVAIDYQPAKYTIPLWSHVARLHNAELRVIDSHHLNPILSPIFNKFLGPTLFPGFENYLYFDADTLPCSKFHPSSFFFPGRFGACRDVFGLRWLQQGLDVFGSLIPSKNFNLDLNWNAGLFSYDSAMFGDFKRYIDWIQLSAHAIKSTILDANSNNIYVGNEQTLSNLFSQLKAWPVTFLDPRCNIVHARTRLAGFSLEEIFSTSSVIHLNDFASKQEISSFALSLYPMHGLTALKSKLS